MFNANDYVHEHKGRWIIAKRTGSTYTAFLRDDIALLTGCSAIYGSLSYVAGSTYSRKRRSDALRCARELYAPLTY